MTKILDDRLDFFNKSFTEEDTKILLNSVSPEAQEVEQFLIALSDAFAESSLGRSLVNYPSTILEKVKAAYSVGLATGIKLKNENDPKLAKPPTVPKPTTD